MLCLVFPILWSAFQVMLSTQAAGGSDQDLCLQDKHLMQVRINSSCLLYQPNPLNCSWSFQSLHQDTQISISISICDGDTTVRSVRERTVERVGWKSLSLEKELDMLYVILQFNMSLWNEWTTYTSIYDSDTLEVLPPPQNISAIIQDGSLLVTWALPQMEFPEECVEYQLDLDDHKPPRNHKQQLFYREPGADPSGTYRVRMRMKLSTVCSGSGYWSQWSHTIILEPTNLGLGVPLLVTMSCVIPMVALAVLLACHQRVFTLLFPPIPCPPPKYMHFLEKNDTFSVFYPATSPRPEEEIMEVEEEPEENPEKTLPTVA